MALSAPPWILDADVIDAKRKYKWDDPWECGYEVPRLQNKVGILWSRAILAVAAGFAEWVIWRFSKETTDPVFGQFVEASWAAVVDRRYLNHVSAEFEGRIRSQYRLPKDPPRLRNVWSDRDFADPVRGPQCIALLNLADVADRTAPNDSGDLEAVYLSNLVEQILGTGEPFKSWRRDTVTRLAKFYTDDGEQESTLGPPVPREALDLEKKFQPSMAPRLLDQFLSGLDHRKNQFLVSPKEMIKLGFEGTPYRYVPR